MARDVRTRTLQEWVQEIGSWTKSAKVGRLPGTIHHLAEEVSELAAIYGRVGRSKAQSQKRRILRELADCQILVLDIAYKLKVNLEEGVRRKHRINMRRAWLPPDRHGVVRHKKG